MNRLDLIQWLRERQANCIHIARNKTRQDRQGWLEDAAYCEAAIQWRAELQKLLYRAVVELSYIQETAGECVSHKRADLIATTEGADIIEQGMRLLGVKDLSVESHEWEPEAADAADAEGR